MMLRLLGYLRLPLGWQKTLNVCISHCSATLAISDVMFVNLTSDRTQCEVFSWSKNVSMSERIPVDFKSRKFLNKSSHNSGNQSKMEFQYKELDDPPKVRKIGVWLIVNLFCFDYKHGITNEC